MSDLIERLRSNRGLPPGVWPSPVCMEAADEIERLRREWERECSDGDAVLHAAGLTPADYRTDGGSINVPKVRSKFMAQEISHRAKIVTLERELAEARGLLLKIRKRMSVGLFGDMFPQIDAFLASDQPTGGDR